MWNSKNIFKLGIFQFSITIDKLFHQKFIVLQSKGLTKRHINSNFGQWLCPWFWIVAYRNRSKHCQYIFSGWRNRFVSELARLDVYKFEFEWPLVNVVSRQKLIFSRGGGHSVLCRARSNRFQFEIVRIDPTFLSLFLFRSFRHAKATFEETSSTDTKQFDSIELLASTLIKSFN